jgi:hypothetical protein
MNWYAELPGLEIGKMEAYFDRNEKFMRYIEPDWRSKKIKKRHPQWELVGSVSQAAMKHCPALQSHGGAIGSRQVHATFRYREEGYAAIDPQGKNREMATASEEFEKFDRMMRELMHKAHPRRRSKHET